jgi:hypothetical protein
VGRREGGQERDWAGERVGRREGGQERGWAGERASRREGEQERGRAGERASRIGAGQDRWWAEGAVKQEGRVSRREVEQGRSWAGEKESRRGGEQEKGSREVSRREMLEVYGKPVRKRQENGFHCSPFYVTVLKCAVSRSACFVTKMYE